MNNKLLSCILVLVLLALFVFVAPQPVNRGIDFVNSKLNQKVAHVPDWRPYRLGLDLLGGTHLVYQADLSKVGDRAAALEGVRDVVERRVNLFGVSEPVVQVSGQDRLIVELAGITDVNQAIKLIGETPLLEFKTQIPFDRGNVIIKQKLGDKTAGITAEALCSPANTGILIQFIAGYGVDPCYTPTQLGGRHLQNAQVVFDPNTAQPQVNLILNEEGKKLFAEITSANVGKTLAIYLDGQPISLPTVRTAITDGNAVIEGGFTARDAKVLATRLNSGALPVPISLISQQTIGATLGKESLDKSLTAGIYGLILVALFMILFYRLPGVVAVIALLLYTVIVLSIYKLIPVTLTLAGIAGFILSLGMAVDANVLIFARMKEEIAAGKSLAASVREGFSRAWLSVRDSHVTTLIGAFILYTYTTSIVKGFAMTLAIGVLTSLFTATVATRAFLTFFTGPKFENKKWLFK